MNKKQELEFTKKIVNNYFRLLRAKKDAEKQGDEIHIRYVEGRIDSIEFVLMSIGIEPNGTGI